MFSNVIIFRLVTTSDDNASAGLEILVETICEAGAGTVSDPLIPT